jgi:hypothetical protein
MSENRKRRILECDKCDKKFDIYSSFYSHMAVKHGDAKISCFHCDEKFHTVSQRNQHYYTFASREIHCIDPQPHIYEGIPEIMVLPPKTSHLNEETKSKLANYYVDLI